jgi:signal transduction histidine kinase/CheY-like chemotaxis protein
VSIHPHPANGQPPVVAARTSGDAWSKETGTDAAGKLRTVIANAPVVLFALDRDGIITLSDGRGLAPMGFEPGEFVGRAAADLFGDLPVIEATGRLTTGAEAVRRSLAGETIRGECTVADAAFEFRLLPHLQNDSREVVGVVGVAAEITERLRAERGLHEAHEKLLLADRLSAIGTLAAGAAHEINNPLTYAMINAEYVLRQLRAIVAEKPPAGRSAFDPSEQVPPLVESLVQALDGMTRIREIVRNLMTFSQGTVETHTLVDVRSVVESSIQMALHEIVHRARLVREMGEVPPVEANEARLGQVFLNLIVNAAQAIPEGDTPKHEVRVVTRTDEAGNAVVEVVDTGAGIPSDVLPRIFDPFFTSKAPDKGVGLGLSISLGTVKALGGTIRVSSHLGRGTAFRVVLPPAKGWRPTRPAPLRDAPAVERKRLLVVDDDARVSEALERALSAVTDVEATTDARAVLGRIADGERWDIILCDLMMPDMSGMDLFREVLRVAPDAAACIVFMTAGAFTPRARAFLDGVRNACLEKPFEIAKLRNMIAHAGSRWQSGVR